MAPEIYLSGAAILNPIHHRLFPIQDTTNHRSLIECSFCQWLLPTIA
ncbi:hypothetical protein H6F76_11480 [Leptolyngbya sp. FACHB-321]|nr:hypothetical protein [Leptolyngbya sp. FACHB-321]MBD2035641.1 hypothetical protein [Leptolyngbya sp. FACHB-321]